MSLCFGQETPKNLTFCNGEKCIGRGVWLEEGVQLEEGLWLEKSVKESEAVSRAGAGLCHVYQKYLEQSMVSSYCSIYRIGGLT